MDEWAAWFADRRHGGDAEQLQRTLEFLLPIRDDVVRHADIGDGDTVLDVGCGEGLIAFAAVERVGPGGSVIFSDVSEGLLDHCRRLATRLGLATAAGSSEPARVTFPGSATTRSTRSRCGPC